MACSAIVEVAGENNADGIAPVGDRRRAEERVDGRARVVFLGAAQQIDPPIVDQQVGARRGDQDSPGADRLAVFGEAHGQLREGREQRRQHAVVVAQVHGNEDSGGECLGQATDHCLQRRDAAGGRPNDDKFLYRVHRAISQCCAWIEAPSQRLVPGAIPSRGECDSLSDLHG
jgi:hypothetical protein